MPTRTHRAEAWVPGALPRRDLILSNGLGGFTPDGREYVIAPVPGQMTPAPWVNVLANAHFGTVISESGVAYTWAENAHQFRLTPWHNDPVSDSSGEALYLRDEESGHFWSPTPLPSPAAMPYVSRHGFGYSVFEHSSGGIRSELWVYVAIDAAVKFSVLKVRNESGRHRKLSATGYVEWVLGDLRSKSSMHVTTEVDPSSGALFARQPLQHGLRRLDHILRCGRCALAPSPATALNSSGAMARSEVPPPWPGRGCSGRRGRRWIPAPPSKSASSSPTARSVRSSSGSVQDAMPMLHATSYAAFAGRLPRAAHSKRCASTGSTRSARCRWKHRTSPSTC